MSKPGILLIGAGGHCRSCIDLIEQEDRFQIAGIVERSMPLDGKSVLSYSILGTDEDLSDLRERFEYALITVGQIKSADVRIKLHSLLQELDYSLPNIVSPLAYVSRHSEIGDGTVIMHHALVNAGAKIGANCIINTKALVEHDAIIENHCHIATGAIVNGGVLVKSGTFMGSGAVSIQNISIAPDSFIKAHTLVR